MESEADVDKLIAIYNDLQSLMKCHLDMSNMIEKQNEGLDQIEIASETILEICQRLDQCLAGKSTHAPCCCAKI